MPAAQQKTAAPCLLTHFLFAVIPLSANAQTISTNMPLPHMEWINLSTAGTTLPLALSHGCLMGPTYTDSTSSLPSLNQAFLFGGRSAAGTTSNGLSSLINPPPPLALFYPHIFNHPHFLPSALLPSPVQLGLCKQLQKPTQHLQWYS
ncbi:hypothetical protein PCANC_13374 [Puccinia coronata f. sp. avenae]|uniref:Uncharacterized protein n=1 Tax=Puccinia coronata f. sp. avenae TaxID=200324 RepID=A0A2N5SGZ8_9BASI|nr:hypothetical protein PCASD_24918 [Puccinia coronata f. sp. avenae]PLW53333.1 hypothetical protein PCANC_13374 [Puccinia coronata f. sp. avenae]